jgi:hypothetical protein
MTNEKWTPESIYDLVKTTETVTEAVQGVAEQAGKELADIQGRWLTAVSDAEVAVERLRAVRCWALFHSAFVDDLHRLAGAENELARIFEEKSRNLGRMILGTTMKVAEAAGVLVPRGATETAVGSTFASFLDEEGIVEEVEEKAEEARLEGVLFMNVVKLMAKAGTRRNGLRAGWSTEEIDYGLQVIMPGVKVGAIEAVLSRLKQAGVIEDFSARNPLIRIYCLKDDYLKRLGWEEEPKAQEPGAEKVEALRRDLRSTLQSNRDASGQIMPWKLSALFYALQDGHPWGTRPVVVATASAEPCCSEVAPQVYQWTELRSGPFVEPNEKGIETRYTDAPREVVEVVPGLCELEPAPRVKNPPHSEAKMDELTPAAIVEVADAIYGILKREAEGGQRRIWKDYDIIGLLGRGAELGVRLGDEHLSQDALDTALTFLVTEGKLEVVPPSPERPWIKRPGWRVK